jgi:hypothetical protein
MNTRRSSLLSNDFPPSWGHTNQHVIRETVAESEKEDQHENDSVSLDESLVHTLQQMPIEDLYELATACEAELFIRRRRRSLTSSISEPLSLVQLDEQEIDRYSTPQQSAEQSDQESSDEQTRIDEVASPACKPKRTVNLNVGGKHFAISVDKLCQREPGSIFCKWFSTNLRTYAGQEIFLDRSPTMFGTILDYLRGDDTILLDLTAAQINRLETEAHFYGLEQLAFRIARFVPPVKLEETHGSSVQPS